MFTIIMIVRWLVCIGALISLLKGDYQAAIACGIIAIILYHELEIWEP